MAETDGFGLYAEFAEKLERVLEACRAAGHDFRIAQGLRTPQKQAEYYCKWTKRKPKDIDKAADRMKQAGAPWLAAVLRSCRDIPRQPAWLTSALPGGGWHQWGEAADCYCYRNGKLVGDGSDPVYKLYAELATAQGLTAGYYFQKQDSGHVQLRPLADATKKYVWPFIDATMEARFGDKLVVALTAGVTPSMLSKAPMVDLGPLINEVALDDKFKDDPTLTVAPLAPARPFVLEGIEGALLTLANVYNRVGGLLELFAARIGLDPVAALAVWQVESGGRDFTPGTPVLRLENHKLFKYWGETHAGEFDQHFQFGGHNGIKGKPSQKHRYRIGTTGPFKQQHVDKQSVEYEAFRLAEDHAGKEAAALSSSWGGPQIMGFNHDICGYTSASALADAFADNERWQVLGFYDFCDAKDLIQAIAAENWHAVGEVYNGNGDAWGPKLKAAFDLKDELLKLPREPGPAATGLIAANDPEIDDIPLTTAPAALA